jgi:tetratricopeptide (TPR) repeat protein
MGDQLVEMLKVSKEIDNKWSWGSVNSMSDDPKSFMIENVITRSSNLFRMENPYADKAFVQISQAMIRYYPELIYGYSNLGAIHLAKKEYKKADEYFKKAIKIDPNDEIVKENIDFLNKELKR